ncbi:MAG: hypothetical protein AB9891_00635 [Anaerolineaceae bacterium]
MLRYKKALLMIVLFSISLGCNVINSSIKAVGNEVSSQIEAQTEPQAIATPTPTFNVSIRTEVISPNNLVSLTKNFSSYDPNTGLNYIYMVVENTSTDPLDIIAEYSGKVTWFDENNQVIDEQEIFGFSTNIFPQEKQLYQLNIGKRELGDRKINLIRIELTKIITVKSYEDSGLKDRINAQKWVHPIATINADTFRVEPYLFSYLIGISKVTVQNNINSQFKPSVIGLYYDANNQLVGVGKSGPFVLPALGSAEVELVTNNLTSVPARMEYYVEMPSSIGVTEMMDILYP